MPIKQESAKQEPIYQDISKKEAKYEYADKESINQAVRKSIPKQFMITSKFIAILGIILLGVIMIAASQFPLSKLLSGNTDITISIGYPITFLEVQLMNQQKSSLQTLNLILDALIYIILAYIIDIAITFITNADIIQTKKDTEEKPKIYKNIKPSIADKLTKQVFKE